MKKMGLTIIVVFLVFTALSYVIHGLLLQPLYQQTPQLLRIAEDAQGHFPFVLLAFLLFSIAFVWIRADRKRSHGWDRACAGAWPCG
jgi:hypothetical protein